MSKYTSQKIKFSIKDFFSKCDQIRSFAVMLVGVKLDIPHGKVKEVVEKQWIKNLQWIKATTTGIIKTSRKFSWKYDIRRFTGLTDTKNYHRVPRKMSIKKIKNLYQRWVPQRDLPIKKTQLKIFAGIISTQSFVTNTKMSNKRMITELLLLELALALYITLLVIRWRFGHVKKMMSDK